VEKCAQAGAERIIGQVEVMTSQMEFVAKVQEVGLKVGLALDIKTPVEALDRTVLNDLDLVLLMGYPAGKGGQAFDRSVLKKVGELVELRKGDITPFRIAVDGGVSEENIRELAGLGVDEVAVGERLFIGGEIQENLEILKENYYESFLGDPFFKNVAFSVTPRFHRKVGNTVMLLKWLR